MGGVTVFGIGLALFHDKTVSVAVPHMVKTLRHTVVFNIIGRAQARASAASRNDVWVRSRSAPDRLYEKRERHFLGQVRASIGIACEGFDHVWCSWNPVREGFDHVWCIDP